MKLTDKHFKHDNILHKIFNRKTLKISYSCTKNISQIINNHNKEIIKEFQDRVNNNKSINNSKQKQCNCKTRNDCPMNGLCDLDNVVYQGIIYPKEDINDKHFWGLKNKGLTPEIQWSILKRSNTLKSFDNRCNLCFEEKLHILLYSEPEKLSNKRSELIARCRHRAKFKL